MYKRKFNKPCIVLSKCLEIDRCRYNGEVIHSELIRNLMSLVEFVPICPEVEIGLGTPRDPIRLVKSNENIELLQPSTQKNVTEKMNSFSKAYLNSLEDVDGFILKHASPSCGLNTVKIYPGINHHTASEKGSGLFASHVQSAFPGLAVEDEGRLMNFRLREAFFTKVFLLADFRHIKKRHKFNELVTFHSQNKFLLMAVSEKHLRIMGKIVANDKGRSSQEIFEEYEKNLQAAFGHLTQRRRHINVLMHLMGYFKNQLSRLEKSYFLELLEAYRSGKIPLSAVTAVLRSWIIKYEVSYLAEQTYFTPYPLELVELKDSGKAVGK